MNAMMRIRPAQIGQISAAHRSCAGKRLGVSGAGWDSLDKIPVIGERNPRPWLASFTLGPRAGKALVELNVRLADSQGVAAYAQMSDGSWWTQRISVVVTIGACEALDTRH